MNNPIDPETLKIPAFRRRKAITTRARQKLIMTALDRKEAGVSPTSTRSTSRKITKRGPVAEVPKIPTTPIDEAPSFEAPLIGDEPEVASEPVALTPSLKPKKIAQVGEVTHYLDKINVAIIMLSKGIKEGDTLLIEGDSFLFIQPVEEMQIERKPVKRAKKGSHIGLKVKSEADVDGKVYKLA